MILQSGAIPYLIRNGRIHYVMITSNNTGNWIFPKGMIEPDMTAAESAANEAFEEAGVTGTVEDKPLGRFTYEKFGREITVDMYPLKVDIVHDDWQEPWRDRKVCEAEEVLDVIDERQFSMFQKASPLIMARILR